MSSLLPFRSKYFRSNVNIQTCLTLESKSRLCGTVVADRPWAAALQRLLATVRRDDGSLWKKGDLADAAKVRPATVSALLNSPAPPNTGTLIALAKVLKVELWEFFVNDEQAAVLYAHAAHRRSLNREDDIAARVEQAVMTKFAHAVKEATKEILSSQPVVPPANPLASPRPTPIAQPSLKRKHGR